MLQKTLKKQTNVATTNISVSESDSMFRIVKHQKMVNIWDFVFLC